ncbi:MAG: DUF2868 domain-containing protein [Gammaproteobacteria bacterium]
MLGALAGVARQIEVDRSIGVRSLAERDRALRPALARHQGRPARQLDAWMRAIDAEGAATAEQVRAAMWTIGMALSVLGIFIGAGLGAAVFHYDGSRPVNVTLALWVFVAAQGALLLLMMIALLPRPLVRWVAPVAALERLLQSVNLGLLWRAAARVLPAGSRAAVQAAMTSGLRHERIHGEVYRWQLLRWSQVVALSFQLGVTGTFAVKIGVQDIAFAWSTQVESLARGMPRIVNALSSPWARVWPQARPSPELVEATRYARLRGGEFGTQSPPDAETLGQWWPFLMACLIVYGAVPRLLTWSYTAYRARRAAEWSLARLPDADLVLARLNEVEVSTSAEPHGVTLHPNEPATASVPDESLPPAPQAFVNWAAAPDAALPFVVALRVAMGGRNSPEDDERAVAAIAHAVRSGAAGGVVIGVRAWEVPTEALFDAVRALRAALDAGPMVTLLPLQAKGEPDRSVQWATHAARLGDPWLRVLHEPDTAQDPA